MRKCWCGNEGLKEYSTEYHRCEECKTLVSKYDFAESIYKITDEEQDLYGKNYWEDVMVKEANVKNLDALIDLYIPERATYWLKTCLKYFKLGASVAEVGCGLGQFSYLLKSVCFQQVAIELSPQICEVLRNILGLNALCGQLCDCDEIYQAIIAIDVFEHLLEPENFLRDCEERLTPDGILVLQMPCYDATLSYESMLQKKPRFQHLLVEDQHTFLYSKEAITRLLRKYGFEQVVFEPAFFGDDYDMFLIASRQEFHENTEQEIDDYLNSVPAGRLVKAMITLFDEKRRLENQVEDIDRERNKILEDVEILTQRVKEDEVKIEEYSSAANSRLSDIEKLLVGNDLLQKENSILQQAADERLENIEVLQKENSILQQAADERLENIEVLQKENSILQRAADERLVLIEKLTQENQILQQAADERLAIIDKLTKKEE